MTYREKRDHKFKILFICGFNNDDLNSIFNNYFENIPYEEESDNSYVSGLSRSHKNVSKIIVTEGTNMLHNESDKVIDISLSEDDDINDIKFKVKDIIDKTSQIDELISKSLKSWDINRVGKAELTIIRLAVYEMCFDNTIDVPIAINEAVELSKVYCDEKACKFVNGVLSTIYKNNERSDNSITTE